MIANTITLTRLSLTFAVITLFGQHRHLDIALILTIVGIFILDALDGYIARQRKETSQTGAILDTLTDRVIENTFWIYFTAIGQTPIWMPIAVMTRGVIVDALQRLHGDPIRGWKHALTRTLISRGLYGALKMLTFFSLAITEVFKREPLFNISLTLATLTVGCCLLRGLPFFFIRRTS